MNYQQTLDYLYGMLPMYQRIGPAAIKKDLSNTIRLCKALGNPHEKFRSVHIAGTNGKGSSSHAIAAILQAAGYKTGLYTSPHLKNFGERIRLNGVEMPKEAIVSWVKQHLALIEEVRPSFFELTVAMAFDYFVQEKVEVAVVEVGLGGRLDSTNVLTPELSLITNIGWDHMALLGNTLTEIAGEKAGIIKEGVPVVIGEKQEEIAQVFLQKATSCNVPLLFASELFRLEVETTDSFQVLKNQQPWLNSLKPDIGASYFLKNVPGVLASIEILQQKGFEKISKEAIRQGLGKLILSTGLKGRWQVLSKNPLVVCDVSHNPDGIRELTAQLQKIDYQQLYLIIGTVNDKDVNTVLSLLPKEAFYYFCQAEIPRALPAVELEKLAATHGLKGNVFPGVNQALANARGKAGPEDLILITGSTFVVAEIEEL